MIFPVEIITKFIEDEGLGPYKIFRDGDEWAVNINEPWGDGDNRMRCGFAQIYRHGEKCVVFNSYKSAAAGEKWSKGNFEGFLKRYKGFVTLDDAKMWFVKTYLYGHLRDMIENSASNKHLEWGEEDEVEITECDLPSDFEPLSIVDPAHSEYIWYLRARGIDDNAVLKYNIMISKIERRIIFPVIDQGKIIFWTGRAIYKTTLPWKNVTLHDIKPIWGLDQVVDNPFIFEAVFDALCVPNGIAILGAANVASDEVINKIARRNYSSYNIIMDNDKPGQASKVTLARKLSAKGKNVNIYNFAGIEEKDFNEMLVKGIDFNFDKRLVRWNFKNEILMKMGKII